jgi:hypothetical protein
MARIRTIKPEFPQSESMGRVSRDARLTFILLWTLADDAGRLRGNSRMLASLLFPYDDDARAHIDTWLQELERERCITRYAIGSDAYLEVSEWRKHQKIDKPSASRLPSPQEASAPAPTHVANPREPSREPANELAKPREPSSEDLGRDQGGDQEGTGTGTGTGSASESRRASRKCPDSFAVTDELYQWASEHEPQLLSEDLERETAKFRDHTFARAINEWPAAWRNWMRRAAENRRPRQGPMRESFAERDERLARERWAEATGRPIQADPGFDFIDMPPPALPALGGA